MVTGSIPRPTPSEDKNYTLAFCNSVRFRRVRAKQRGGTQNTSVKLDSGWCLSTIINSNGQIPPEGTKLTTGENSGGKSYQAVINFTRRTSIQPSGNKLSIVSKWSN